MGLYSGLRSVLWSMIGYQAESYNKFLKTSECWTREQIESYRNDKVKKLISHCYENVPYYRNVMDEYKIKIEDIKSAEDITKLPILTKDIIRNFSRELMAKNISEMKIGWSKTGGTTGEPMRICKNSECYMWTNMCHERGLRWGGLETDAPRVRLYGGSLGIDKSRITTRIGSVIRGDLFLPAFELRADTVMSYINKIRRSKCRFLLGYASSIYRLALLTEEMDQELEFDAVFPTAELLLSEWKDVIHRVFKCNVLPYYGSGEIGALGFYTSEVDAYIIPEEHVLIEIMQDDASTHLYGDGSFVITDLDNYAMPLIRYVNGDAGKLSPYSNGPFPFSRIERLDGRYNSFLMTDSGDLISGAIGPHVFRYVPCVQSYRIIQEEPLKVIIKVVPKRDFNEQYEQLITNLFSKHLGSRMKIIIEKVSDIPLPPSGKSIFVVNRCL